jgi:hypothetical protein
MNMLVTYARHELLVYARRTLEGRKKDSSPILEGCSYARANPVGFGICPRSPHDNLPHGLSFVTPHRGQRGALQQSPFGLLTITK